MSTQYCGCDPTAKPHPHRCSRHQPIAVSSSPSGWALYDALALVREIQPEIQTLGFHVALAGGVLNKGYSDKDLDLVFIPMTNEERPSLAGLCTWFNDRWGRAEDNCTDPKPCVSLRYQASYVSDGKRIDVFVV